ncbi:hypothetical protein ACFE04_023132 [Oxalis oulophora]
MLGCNNGNAATPVFIDENCFQYPTNASNQLQLFGNLPAGRSTDPINHFGNNEHIPPVLRPNKRRRDIEDFPRPQKLLSLNYNVWQDEADRAASIPKPNAVSTGLRLSYDDDERNSSVTSASGNMAAPPSIFLSLGDSIRTQLDRQKEEFDQYIKIQEEQLTKGVRDLRQRHMSSFLATIETGVNKKLQEKDIEIDNMNRKNKELAERIKQVTVEAQSWHNRAKYNESIVNLLKTNLQQAISQGGALDQGKEGFGDSEVDDATSYVDPHNFLSSSARVKSSKKDRPATCRSCNVKDVSMLWMPCRHLCLCEECDMFINSCPVCQSVKTASVQVFWS